MISYLDFENTKKKLCFIIPSLQPGGMERVMSELIHYFNQKKELEINLVLYGKMPIIFYNLPENIEIFRPKMNYREGLRFLIILNRALYLRRMVKKIQPDTILSFGEIWNSFVLISLAGLNYPIFISDRCNPERKFGIFHDTLRRILYSHASGIIVQTSKAREVYQRQFRKTIIQTIGNPIRNISSEGNIIKENIVLSVGRLIPSKNYEQLIKTFARLNAPSWRLVIVGGNALKLNVMKHLKALIKKLDFEDRIILTGTRSDVDSFYAASKIFVLTSESEGFPNVIGEAMSASLPVIAFDCVAGPSEMIEDGFNGFLVPLHDYYLLEEKLKCLINDPEMRERLGHRARSDINRYSIERIGEAYYSFIMSKNRIMAKTERS